jgi:hypothetical protein
VTLSDKVGVSRHKSWHEPRLKRGTGCNPVFKARFVDEVVLYVLPSKVPICLLEYLAPLQFNEVELEV